MRSLALLAFLKASVEGGGGAKPKSWPVTSPYPQCTDPLTPKETPDRANPIAPGTLVRGTNGPTPGAMTLEHEASSTPDNRWDFTWPSDEARQAAIDDGTFIDYNLNIAGIKEWDGRYFMSMPRWKAGVPATIVEYIPKGSDHPLASPDKELFKPWPSFEWNRYSDGTPEDCKTTIQYSHGLFIDGTRLWALDIGAKDLFTPTSEYVCPPKIMAFDMAECDANPECEPVQYYEFPNECARHAGPDSVGIHQFLNDLFVDPLTDWVYISDAMFTPQNDGLPGGEYTGGMIGLNIELGICNRLQSMETDILQEAPEGSKFTLNGINFQLSQAADGVALDPVDGSQVIFSSIGAYTKWSIPAHSLRDPTMTNEERAATVSRMFIKDDQSDGISVDPQGNLWVGGMQSSSIRRYNRDEWGYYDPNPDIIFSDCALGHWFDSFGEAPGKMISASNEIMLFFCEIGDGECPAPEDRSYTFRIFSAPVEGGTAMDTILAQKGSWTKGWPDYAALAAGTPSSGTPADGTPSMKLMSSTFEDGGNLPGSMMATCGAGDNTSPALSWEGAPEGTESFAITMVDPTVPWVHWLIYDIPATTTSLPEGLPKEAILADGTLQGINMFPLAGDFTGIGYDGPCPAGEPHPLPYHQYTIMLYALDKKLETPEMDYETLMVSILGGTLGYASMKATYEKEEGAQRFATLSSSAFKNGGAIPAKHATCGLGDNISPPLSWKGAEIPEGTTSLAIAMVDLAVPWVHWIISGIPTETTMLEEGIPKETLLPDGMTQGTNMFPLAGDDFTGIGYDGPCPPGAPHPLPFHTYYFSLYALSEDIDATGMNYWDFSSALVGKVTGYAQLEGTFTAPPHEEPPAPAADDKCLSEMHKCKKASRDCLEDSCSISCLRNNARDPCKMHSKCQGKSPNKSEYWWKHYAKKFCK